jgi:hypothetical protein
LDINTQSSSTIRPIVYRSACPCEAHYDKQLVERNYDLNIDKLFDLMFGTNEFVRTYRQAQRFYDDTATEWTMNEETKCRERVLNYKMPFESTLVGKGTITTREKQVNIDRNYEKSTEKKINTLFIVFEFRSVCHTCLSNELIIRTFRLFRSLLYT